jgi:hypothetical protein
MSVNFFSQLPLSNLEAGLVTEFGLLLPPGGRVAAYVRSSGFADLDPLSVESRLVTTLAAALPYARAGKGDIIVVLPGHTEDVEDATMLDGLVEGTRIVGVGNGTMRPKFTFTETASQWTLDKADVMVAGLNLQLNGAAVVKALNITGANTLVTRCDIDVGNATSAAVIAIEFGTGSVGSQLIGNQIHGLASAAVTDAILVAAAVDGLRIEGNEIFCATGAVSTGPIRIGAAATRLMIKDNIITNNLTSSETGIGCGAFAATGWIVGNYVSVEAGTPVADTIELNAACLMRCFENYGSDTKNTSGLLAPAVVT